MDIDGSEEDESSNDEEEPDMQFKKEKEIYEYSNQIKKEKYGYFMKWCLQYKNVILDKYILAFYLIISREKAPKQFLVYCGEKDTYAFLKLEEKIYYHPNTDEKLLFRFGEYIPEIKGGKSWRNLFNNTIINNHIDNYFTNIDINNGIKGRKMRHNMLFKKDPDDKDEICFNKINQVPLQIKLALEKANNLFAQKYCDYNKNCFWVTCDKDVDLNPILNLNNKDYYIKTLNDSWENYSAQKTLIVILEKDYSERIGDFLKLLTDKEKIVAIDNNVVPVHDKVIVLSFLPLAQYFKGDPFNEIVLNIKFQKMTLNRGKNIEELIEKIKNL